MKSLRVLAFWFQSEVIVTISVAVMLLIDFEEFSKI